MNLFQGRRFGTTKRCTCAVGALMALYVFAVRRYILVNLSMCFTTPELEQLHEVFLAGEACMTSEGVQDLKVACSVTRAHYATG